MKKLWEKATEALAWVGAGCLSLLALLGAVLLLRKKTDSSKDLAPVATELQHSEELANANQAVQTAEHAKDVAEARHAVQTKGAALERDPAALAAELTRLSD